MLGVPTFRCKMAGVRGVVRPRRRRRRHPRAVRLLRDGGRHVLDHRAADGRADERARRHAPLGGPGRGRRASSPALLYAFTAGDHAIAGKAVFGAVLIVVILFMPQGVLGRFLARRRRAPAPSAAEATPRRRGGGAGGHAEARGVASERILVGARHPQGVSRRARAGRRRHRRARRRDPRPRSARTARASRRSSTS